MMLTMARRRTKRAHHHEPESVLRYRRSVGPGRIMRPSTFESIVRKTMARYGVPRERAQRIAGAAYWNTAEARARGGKRRRRAAHRAGR